MANTKSIQKVLEYLKQKQGAVSTSDICTGANLKWCSVKQVLEILALNNQVLILTTEGGTSLVKFKGSDTNGTNS